MLYALRALSFIRCIGGAVFADGARRVAAAGFVFYAPAQTLMFVAAQSETHSPFEWKRMQY